MSKVKERKAAIENELSLCANKIAEAQKKLFDLQALQQRLLGARAVLDEIEPQGEAAPVESAAVTVAEPVDETRNS